jgi:transposase
MGKNKAKPVKTQKALLPAAEVPAARPRYYVGLDVSQKTTQVCILDGGGKVFLEKELKTHPAAIASYLRKHCSSDIERVALETGGMSSWLYHGLKKSGGLPVMVLDALTVNRTGSCQ